MPYLSQTVARVKAHFSKNKDTSTTIHVTFGKGKSVHAASQGVLSNTNPEAAVEHAEYVDTKHVNVITRPRKKTVAFADQDGKVFTTVHEYDHPEGYHYSAREMTAVYTQNELESKIRRRCDGLCKKRKATKVMTIDECGYQNPQIVWRNNQKRMKVAGNLFL